MRNQKFLLPLAIAAAFAASEAKSANFNNLEVPFTEISSPQKDTLTVIQIDDFLKDKSGEVNLAVILDKYNESTYIRWLGYIIREYPNLIIDLEFVVSGDEEFQIEGLNDCKALRSIKLPSSVHEISKDAFRNCENLESVQIENRKLALYFDSSEAAANECAFSHSSFWGCKNFQSKSNKNIGVINGTEFFYLDDNMTDIEIPGKLLEKCFCIISDFNNLKTVKIKAGANEIGLTYMPSNITSYNDFDISEPIPQILITNCQNLVSIEIEEGLKSFSGVSQLPNLEIIKLPESLERIWTITGCPKLKSIKLPSKLKLTDKGKVNFPQFGGCKSLETIEIPEGVEVLDARAFSNCESLKSIKLPSSLKSIEWIARGYSNDDFFTSPFMNCKSLTTLEIPEGITELPDFLFYNCESLKTVKIPSRVKIIKSHAFSNCKSLAEIYLPQNLEEIGEFAFEGCSSLKSIEIPQSVKEVGKGAFWACSGLKNGKDPNKIKVGGKTYDYFPENVKCDMFKESIPAMQFAFFTAMKSIVIPNNIKEIGCQALSFCHNLTSAEFPDDFVTDCNSMYKEVGFDNHFAINYCAKLKTIDCKNLSNLGESYQYMYVDTLIIRADKYFGGNGTIFGQLPESDDYDYLSSPPYRISDMNLNAKIYVQDKYVQQYKDEMEKINKIIDDMNLNRTTIMKNTDNRVYNYEFLPLSEYKK